MKRSYAHNFNIAFQAIFQNKLRAVLTSLGIIFGVASVIAMLAIGKGAEQEILEKMKILGANNIIIKKKDIKTLKKEYEDNEDAEKQAIVRFSPGLSIADVNSLRTIPNILAITPEIEIEITALKDSFSNKVKLIGIGEDYFSINAFKISEGENFSNTQFEQSQSVCIIGNSVKTKLFPTENAIGKQIKCGKNWLTVIGVLESKQLSKANIGDLGIRDYNFDVYIPYSTMLIRYTNRSMITRKSLQNDQRQQRRNPNAEFDISQIDKIIIKVDDTEMIAPVADVVNRMLLRRHNQESDFEIVISEILLKQEQETKRLFNLVLGIIASISLIVGGIGIMNIMLASVLERTKEIGIRMAIGAYKFDILLQFLIEAVAISLGGGLLGIALGVAAALIIEQFTGIITIITPFSIILSFVVAISVGLIFGIAPARKASEQSPIELLRYE